MSERNISTNAALVNRDKGGHKVLRMPQNLRKEKSIDFKMKLCYIAHQQHSMLELVFSHSKCCSSLFVYCFTHQRHKKMSLQPASPSMKPQPAGSLIHPEQTNINKKVCL